MEETNMTERWNDKVALVTGANKGIGFEIARQLGSLGIVVLLGARDEGRGQRAAAELREAAIDARHVPLDVTSEEMVDAAARWIDDTFGRLDILVNNAGVTQEHDEFRGRPSAVPIEALRRVYETNVFGVVAVTNALLPLLRKAPAARIVNMSSSMGSLALWSDPTSPQTRFAPALLAYNSSKTALNALTVQYAHELHDSAIKVNAADPGYVATDLNNHSGTRSAAEGARIAVQLATLPDDGTSGAFLDEKGPVPW
jgi:NAD(P)-dependent dehydrogenase (short-subunit alcohol dehydrogenase family)